MIILTHTVHVSNTTNEHDLVEMHTIILSTNCIFMNIIPDKGKLGTQPPSSSAEMSVWLGSVVVRMLD